MIWWMTLASRHKTPEFSLDAVDRRILTALQEDASLTNVGLAARVGSSPSPCLARVRQLEEAGRTDRGVRTVATLRPLALGAVRVQDALRLIDRLTKPPRR
jgi:DNA-binding Lrp family transcriptional regulator